MPDNKPKGHHLRRTWDFKLVFLKGQPLNIFWKKIEESERSFDWKPQWKMFRRWVDKNVPIFWLLNLKVWNLKWPPIKCNRLIMIWFKVCFQYLSKTPRLAELNAIQMKLYTRELFTKYYISTVNHRNKPSFRVVLILG